MVQGNSRLDADGDPGRDPDSGFLHPDYDLDPGIS